MIKAIVTGAAGRIGSHIVDVVLRDREFKLVGAIEKKAHKAVGKDIGKIVGRGECKIVIVDELTKAIKDGDVVIDFTTPHASLEFLRVAVNYKKPIVIGTTGFTEEEVKEIEKLATYIPCVKISNVNVGINIIFELIKQAAKMIGEDWDIDIVGVHHRDKKDAPSGTSLEMAQIIAKTLDKNFTKIITNESKTLKKRSKGEIRIHTIRMGDVPGEHTIIFAGAGERIEITHRTTSLEAKARGALKAAKFVVKASPGLYNMQDVLGLRS